METRVPHNFEPQHEVPPPISDLKSNPPSLEYPKAGEQPLREHRAYHSLAELLEAMKDWIDDGSEDGGPVIL